MHKLAQSKNGEGRTVYLNELALDVFRSLWTNTDTVPEEPVFGLDVTPEEVSMAFIRACRSAGVEDFRFMTFATPMPRCSECRESSLT